MEHRLKKQLDFALEIDKEKKLFCCLHRQQQHDRNIPCHRRRTAFFFTACKSILYLSILSIFVFINSCTPQAFCA